MSTQNIKLEVTIPSTSCATFKNWSSPLPSQIKFETMIPVINEVPQQPFPFLELPSEIRLLIYHMIFQGSQICIKWPDFVGWNRWRTNASNFIISRCDNFPNEILMTCKFIRTEAMHALALNTSIHVGDNPYRRLAPVWLGMSSAWRDRIQTIEYAGSPRFHLNLSLYSNLRLVVLEHKVYHCNSPDMPLKKEDVPAVVKGKISKFDNSLMNRGVYGLRPEDGINVRMRVWLLNAKMKISDGWDVMVDARD